MRQDAVRWPLTAAASAATPEPAGPLQTPYASPGRGRECWRLTHRGSGLCPCSAVLSLCLSVAPSQLFLFFFFFHHEHFLELLAQETWCQPQCFCGPTCYRGNRQKGMLRDHQSILLPQLRAALPRQEPFCTRQMCLSELSCPQPPAQAEAVSLLLSPVVLVARQGSIACPAAEQSPVGLPRAAIWAPAASLIK